MLTNKILCFLPPVRCTSISSLAHKGIMLSARNFDADGCCCRRRRCCQHVPAVKYYIETSVFIRAKTIKKKQSPRRIALSSTSNRGSASCSFLPGTKIPNRSICVWFTASRCICLLCCYLCTCGTCVNYVSFIFINKM